MVRVIHWQKSGRLTSTPKEIHATMIQDTVRTSTYASFVLKNPSMFNNAIVLDVGCGTGILSLFAARAGAAHVYAIDASDIAEKAKKIVEANGLSHVITYARSFFGCSDTKSDAQLRVIQGKVEDIKLPVEKVDIIISEWMGMQFRCVFASTQSTQVTPFFMSLC